MNEACIRQLIDVTRDRPRHADAWFTLGAALYLKGDPDGALSHIETALELNPNYVDAAMARAFVLGDLGRPREGYASLRPLLTLAPDDFELVFATGVFCMRHGWQDTGVAQLRRAVGLLPGAPFVRAWLAAALDQIGEVPAASQARAECDRLRAALDAGTSTAISSQPLDTEFLSKWPAPCSMYAQLVFARFLQQNGDAAAAAIELSCLHSRYPGHPTAMIETGRLQAIAGNARAAECCMRAAIVVHPGCHAAMVELGFLETEFDRMDEAVAHLRAAVAMRPIYADYRRHLGTLLLDLGRIDEAVEQLEQAYILNQQDAHIALRLAAAYVEQGRWADAQLMLDSGEWREWAESLVICADARLRAGDPEGAREVLARVLSSDPGHPTALGLLATIGA